MNSVAGSAASSAASAALAESSSCDARHRALVRAGRIAERHVLRRFRSASRTPHALHLVPVVIFGVDPEHGDRGHAVLGPHALGEPDGGQRLEQREQRAAEEAGLLAGDDGDRVRVAELGGGGDRFGRCAAAALLRLQRRRRWRRASRGCCCVRAIASRQAAAIGGIAGEEVREPRVVEGVVRRQASNPREPPDVDGKACGRAGQTLTAGAPPGYSRRARYTECQGRSVLVVRNALMLRKLRCYDRRRNPERFHRRHNYDSDP